MLADGWLRTGDIGLVDGDDFLFIVDHKKDMPLRKGYNVYPPQLEELLNAHPDVLAAAVVGKPDPAAGELPVAFVVPRGPEVAAAALMAAVNERVAPCQRLREVRFVDKIPVSAAGRILKREPRDRLAADPNPLR
ncbi:long-chain acyl-CoA synthetase [Actinokineospora iranica]|uniref:Long-chain acyl-CoA synthetase n=1 Tax=Actinokineospora iranica TaxID=1271860 RepID=A0A1G6LGB1_9PSEU|nr:long-chain acyl-CoA synthetase [Actinokineospora iranica]